MARSIGREFRAPISGQSLPALRDAYRAKLKPAVGRSRFFDLPILPLGGEGVGKTTAHLAPFADEAFDNAASQSSDDTRTRIAGFAFRSRHQANEKAKDFRAWGYNVVVVK